MKLAGEIKLRTQIGILGSLGAIACLVMLGIYLVGEQRISRANAEAENFAAIERLAAEIESGTLQMRRREKDFLLRRDLVHAEKYRAAAAHVMDVLRKQAESTAGTPLAEPLDRLIRDVPLHQAQFETLVSEYEAMGLDEKSGLEGQLREAVHAVETKVREAGLDALTAKMLMMRRHEKDYMLRRDEKYVGSIAERRAEFEALLAGTDLSAGSRSELTSLLATYQESFLAWVARAEAVAAASSKLSEIFAGMEPDFEALFSGAHEGAAAAEQTAHAVRGDTKTMLLSMGAVFLLLALATAALIGRFLVRSLRKMAVSMTRLAEGDKTVAVDGTGRRDEIGEMARAVLVFKENAIRMEQMRVEQEQAEARAEQDKRRAMMELADAFETSVKEIVETVSAASTEMQSVAESMTATAEETSRQAGAVAAASEQTSANVQTVAGASEEMASSIGEIGQQVGNSSRIASEAAAEADRTNAEVAGLVESTQKIGDIIGLINDIASQTNLLALNATIEAARAGEAGKGFAVVASEVKSLASQTARATEEIATQIAGVQHATTSAAGSIRGIGETVKRLNEIAAAIAAAVEQQGAATGEISRNVQEAANGTREVTANIAHVNQAASETGAAASQVLGASGELARQSQALKTEVQAFIARVRAA